MKVSGAASAIGWHLADGVIGQHDAIEILKQCIEVEDQTILLKIDEMLSGFLRKLDGETREGNCIVDYHRFAGPQNHSVICCTRRALRAFSGRIPGSCPAKIGMLSNAGSNSQQKEEKTCVNFSLCLITAEVIEVKVEMLKAVSKAAAS